MGVPSTAFTCKYPPKFWAVCKAKYTVAVSLLLVPVLVLYLVLVGVGVRSSFGRWYLGMFKQMFVGKGRSSRKEYWLFHLGSALSLLPIPILILILVLGFGFR